jgi:hypothetical protein
MARGVNPSRGVGPGVFASHPRGPLRPAAVLNRACVLAASLAYLLVLALARSAFLTDFFVTPQTASRLPLTLASGLAHDVFRSDLHMPMTRTTISFAREDMELLRKAAKRQG